MNGAVLMDLDYEKERLLGLIEVYNLYDEDEINISLSNFDLNIEKVVNTDKHNLTIICDVNANSDNFKKYDKSNSEICLNYTFNDEEFSTIHMDSTSFYFDSGLFEPEFTGHKTVKYTVYDINLDKIEEIIIDIEAFLYEKEDDNGEGIEIVIEFDQEKFENELRKFGFTKHD